MNQLGLNEGVKRDWLRAPIERLSPCFWTPGEHFNFLVRRMSLFAQTAAVYKKKGGKAKWTL